MLQVNWNPVHPRYKQQLRIGNTLFLGIFFLSAIAAAIWVKPVPTWIPLTIAGAIVALWLLLFIFWAPARTRVTRYALAEDVVMFQVGALWHRETAVTHNRLQHIEIERGPVERMLGISRLKLYTAGGISSDLTIPGLAIADSERIRDSLIAIIQDEQLLDEAITSVAEQGE